MPERRNPTVRDKKRKARMPPDRINADKPHLWKADIAASVDQFNQWFMRFAPLAFRSTRVKTTEHVKAALLAGRLARQGGTNWVGCCERLQIFGWPRFSQDG